MISATFLDMLLYTYKNNGSSCTKQTSHRGCRLSIAADLGSGFGCAVAIYESSHSRLQIVLFSKLKALTTIGFPSPHFVRHFQFKCFLMSIREAVLRKCCFQILWLDSKHISILILTIPASGMQLMTSWRHWIDCKEGQPMRYL
jgi:hypothetical protein